MIYFSAFACIRHREKAMMSLMTSRYHSFFWTTLTQSSTLHLCSANPRTSGKAHYSETNQQLDTTILTTMKPVAIATTLLLATSQTAAFSTSSSFSGSALAQAQKNNAALTMEYIPS